ncbi:MAG: hypothetical protein V1835_01370 [Candidatus Micrarchaeota archaeon]
MEIWKKILLGIGIILLAYVILVIIVVTLRSDNHLPGSNIAQCKAQMMMTISGCMNDDGTWRSEVRGLEFNKTGVSMECANTFQGTSWYNDSTHFNCGEKPG